MTKEVRLRKEGSKGSEGSEGRKGVPFLCLFPPFSLNTCVWSLFGCPYFYSYFIYLTCRCFEHTIAPLLSQRTLRELVPRSLLLSSYGSGTPPLPSRHSFYLLPKCPSPRLPPDTHLSNFFSRISPLHLQSSHPESRPQYVLSEPRSHTHSIFSGPSHTPSSSHSFICPRFTAQ